jgi:hypothetical protein
MTSFFQNISSCIPFNVDNLLDLSKVEIFIDPPCDHFVHKQTFSSEILNPLFYEFLCNKNLKVQKVIVWHWYNKNPFWAHIDSDKNGVVSPSAINWTINNNQSQVNFYDLSDVEKNVKFGNEIDENSRTDNVTAYIPINVKGLVPNAVWNDRGPAVINTGVPHLVVAPEMRTSISLNFENPIPTISDIIDRLCIK